MSWEDDLQEASMDGIGFPILGRSRSGSRDAARVKPPYQDGQGVEPTGLGVAVYQFTIPFFPDVEGYEDLYPGVYRNVLALLVDPERPTFEYIDPIDGAVRVFAAEWSDVAEAEARDGVMLQVQLEQVLLEVEGNRVFAVESPSAVGREAAAEADETMTDAGVEEETVQSSMQAAGAPLSDADTQVSGSTFSSLWSDFEDALSQAQLRADEVEGYLQTYRARIIAVTSRIEAVRTPQGWPMYGALMRMLDAGSSIAQRAVARAVPIVDFTTTGTTSAGELAARFFGDRSRSQEITNLNPGLNPMRIPSGTVLKVRVR